MISALFAAAVSASAFGIIDVDQHGRGGGLAANRIGLRGGAAAGGNDLQASYWLETGVDPATGRLADPHRLLSRRGTVSLASPRFGELRMGRDFAPGFLALLAAFSHAGRQDSAIELGGQLRHGRNQWRISWIHAGGNQLALGLVHELSPQAALYASAASGRGAQIGLHQQF